MPPITDSKSRSGTIAGQRAVLEQAVGLVVGTGLSEPVRIKAQREAEKLAATMGQMGASKAARLAREMTLLFSTSRPSSARLMEVMTALRKEIEKAISPVPVATSLHFLLIDHEMRRSETMAAEGLKLGIRVELAFDLKAAAAMVDEKPPHLILVDLYFPNGAAPSLQFVREIHQRHPGIPIVVLSAQDTLEDRLQVAQTGAAAFIRKILPASQILLQAREEYRRITPLGLRILLAGADERRLRDLQNALSTMGFQVKAQMKFSSVWEQLSEVHPETVVLDAGGALPEALAICRMIRNEARWTDLPISILVDTGEAAAAFLEAGADDCFSAQLPPKDLARQVELRLRRNHIYRRTGQTDRLTGLPTKETALKGFEQLLDLSERQSQPLCLAAVGLDQLEAIRRAEGAWVADDALAGLSQLLRRGLRSFDMITRWEPDLFIAALYGIDRDHCSTRLGQILNGIRKPSIEEPFWSQHRASLSAGIAQLGPDGDDIASLVRTAIHAMRKARDAGGNRALKADEVPSPRPLVERYDIVLVEGDPATAQALLDALQGEHWEVTWLRSGTQAIEALTGSKRSMMTSTVLLSCALPDMDGFAALSLLQREVVVRNVIMLAHESASEDVITAKRMGAFDYLTKPFDLHRLVQRVRQAIEG